MEFGHCESAVETKTASDCIPYLGWILQQYGLASNQTQAGMFAAFASQTSNIIPRWDMIFSFYMSVWTQPGELSWCTYYGTLWWSVSMRKLCRGSELNSTRALTLTLQPNNGFFCYSYMYGLQDLCVWKSGPVFIYKHHSGSDAHGTKAVDLAVTGIRQ